MAHDIIVETSKVLTSVIDGSVFTITIDTDPMYVTVKQFKGPPQPINQTIKIMAHDIFTFCTALGTFGRT